MTPKLQVDEHITDGLSTENKIFVKFLEKKMIEQPKRMLGLGKFICGRMKNDGVEDFCKLSDETRPQAIVEYVVIGLISGAFVEEDFKKFM